MTTCKHCGMTLEENAKFCTACGAGQENIPAAVPGDAPAAIPAKPKKSKKWVAIVCAAVALLAVAGVLGVLFLSTLTPRSAVVYLKDGELYGVDLSSLETMRITKKLLDDESIDMDDFGQNAYILAMFVRMSEDGERIFYPDRLSADGEGVTVYYRSLTDADADPEKMDSGIQTYSISLDGKNAVYLKQDGALYRHNLEEREKIDTQVEDYFVSDDVQKLWYVTEDKDLYFQRAGEETEKMASEIDRVVHWMNDCETVYYLKGKALYRQTIGEDRVKLVTDVEDVYALYETGEMYYTKWITTEYKSADYVTDSKKAQDAAMTEPVEPTMPQPDAFASTDAYLAAYDAYVEEMNAYWKKTVEYEEKLWRDTLRSELATAKIEYESRALYYFDGSEETLLNDNMHWTEAWDENDARAMVYASGLTEIEPIELSEMYSADEVETRVYSCLQSGREAHLAIDGTSVSLGEVGLFYAFAGDGKTLYVLEDESGQEDVHEPESGTLYAYELTATGIGKKTKMDDNVYSRTWDVTSDGKLMYFKNAKENIGDLYIDKKEIGKQVAHGSVIRDEQNHKISFLSEWSEAYQCGTLQVWDGKSTETVSEDVHELQLAPDGSLLYLYDYSLTQNEGELRLYRDGESHRIDRDVRALLPSFMYYF